jgi:hypothetical protein
VNDRKIEGTKTLTHTIANNMFNTRVVVANGKITFKDGTYISFTSDRTRSYNPNNTVDTADDSWMVSGTFSGTDRKGQGYTATISSANSIVIKNSCVATSGYAPVSGEIVITPTGMSERVINFGDGTCDRQFTVTVNGKTTTHVMK